MRERHLFHPPATSKNGITPARAGKTHLSIYNAKKCRDHPRSCGKDYYKEVVPRKYPGSPPLVRERQIASLSLRRFYRITPARAGKTTIVLLSISGLKDHPRSCGKDPSSASKPIASSGSPPLVRERRACAHMFSCRVGITPARAGKTLSFSIYSVASQDHPRSCGKDICPCNGKNQDTGSPPLVRERLPFPDR